jgi:hypothetical protein
VWGIALLAVGGLLMVGALLKGRLRPGKHAL